MTEVVEMRRTGLLGVWILVFAVVAAAKQDRCAAGEDPGFDAADVALRQLVARKAKLEREAREREEERARRRGVSLGGWFCAGPFKHEQFGHAPDSLAFIYEVERDVLDAGRDAADLDKVYQARSFPGLLDTERPWQAHPEWVDGYRHLLPRGPAPARGEAVYLYRTISAAEATQLEMRVYAEDYIAAWLNGKEIGRVNRGKWTASRFPSALCVELPLEAGENRLLVKAASLCGSHGFAFSLEGVTPTSALTPGQWSASILRDDRSSNFSPVHRPLSDEGSEVEGWPEPESRAACIASIGERLRMPAEEVSSIVGEIRFDEAVALDRKVAEFVDMRDRLRSFRFDVTMTPMFDPARSVMVEEMDRSFEASPGGRAYLEGLKRVRPIVEQALQSAKEGRPDSVATVREAYGRLEAMWRDAAARIPAVLFIRRPYVPVDARAPYTCAGSTPSSICVLERTGAEWAVRVLFEEPHTAIYDMCLDFDAENIFFSAKRPGVEGGWHVYRISVDGSGLTQITEGPCDDVSPCVLPDGGLMFVSTRDRNWVTCAPLHAGHLFIANADGTEVRKASGNIDSDHTPRMLEDGRVMFTRWDYGVEKNVFARHALWTVNPDGTNFQLFAGNTIEDPAAFWKARPVPGRPMVVCVFGPHHSHQTGMIGLVGGMLGTEAPRGEGFRFITSEIPSYADTTFAFGYEDPYPLSERLFLVTYGGDGRRQARLYLLDDRGNRRCLHEAPGSLGCYSPMPLRATPRPPGQPARSKPHAWAYRDPFDRNASPDDSLTATLFLEDVYRGLSRYVERGEAKFLQVMEQVPKTTRHEQDAWGTSPLTGRGTVHVRRLIGVVPIDDDGDAFFQVPALRSISLNVLNAEGKMLMRMGADIHLMPGEQRSCVGCHEAKEEGYATPRSVPRPIGSIEKLHPARPWRPNWGTNGLIDYQRVVQPIWDRHCTECHSGALPEGAVDMTGDRTRYFSISYDNLVERELVDYHNVFALDHDETTPKGVGSYVSRIGEYIDTPEHYGVKMSPEEQRTIYAWIDANVPYYSTYRFTRIETRGSRDAWALSDAIFKAFDRRCMGCHRREVFNPSLYGGAAVVSSSLWTNRGITAHGFPRRWPETAHIGPELRVNLTNPSHSLLLQAPLAKEAGGFGYCRDEQRGPVFIDKNDPDYRCMLGVIEAAKRELYLMPRVDMSPEHVAAVLPTVKTEEELAPYVPHATLSERLTLLRSLLPAGIENLAKRATGASESGHALQGTPAGQCEQGPLDGDPGTLWDEIDGKESYAYSATFPAKTRISALSVTGWRHHDFAPRGFEIVCDGVCVGRISNAQYRSNRLTLAFPPVRCSKLELRIDDYFGGSPAIRELELYDLGETASTEASRESP